MGKALKAERTAWSPIRQALEKGWCTLRLVSKGEHGTRGACKRARPHSVLQDMQTSFVFI